MAAQDAELQLKVSLDLTFFKQQLAGLGTSAAGYRLPVNIKFDRLSVQKELNTLGDNIKKRTYRLNVETNIAAEIKNAGTLAKALRGLDNAAQKNKGIANRVAAGGSAGAGTLDASNFKFLERANKEALTAIYQSMAKAKVAMRSIGEGTNEELRNAILSGLPGVTADIATGIADGLDPKMKVSGKKAAKFLIDAFRTAAGIASPSKVFKQLGEFSADGLEIGFINGLKDFKDKAVAEIKSLVKTLQQEARVGMIGVGGLLSPIAQPRGAATRARPGATLSNVALPNQDPGRSYSKILNSISLLTGDPKLYRGRMQNLGVGRLPSSLLGAAQSQFDLESLAPGFRQSRLTFKKSPVDDIIDQAFFGRGTLPKASSALNSFGNSLERIASVARALPGGILSSASGRLRFAGFNAPSMGEVSGVFEPSGRKPVFAPYNSFAAFSQRATAITAGGGNPPGGPPVPPVPPGGNVPPVPPVPPGGGGGGIGGFGGFGRAMGGLPNLPGSGVIRELGSEFAFATKQVLLFGQAYKLLGILQDFPAQVGAAVGQLQSFRNTLNTIAPTAEEVRASNELILDLMNRYNVPLQSARDGFTKLYASMAPAGFSGDEIRELFTGITKAAATFGMSADKVDRVNYAFAQMASKGQIMSEELKGQLGDVLPGAMALFAEAAGFEGPKAIQDFSAALEDGAYKGEAMVALLKNVGIVMNKEFGPGAEGAARTFQGVINRMQNSMILLYESFEPIAVGFLNTVVKPMTDGIKQLADGLNAFFAGEEAKTAGGGAIAQQLNQLKPSFDGIAENLQQLKPLFDTLTQAAGQLGKIFIQLAGNPFTGYLLRTYLAVLPLVTAIKILNLQAIIPMIASLVRAIPAFVAFNAAKLRLISTNKALQLAMQLTGNTSTVTAGKIRLVTAALATLAAPAILLGIGALIERFMMLKGAVDGVRQSTQQMLQSISSMANAGVVKDLRNVAATTQQQISTFEWLSPFVSGGAFGPKQKLTPQAAAKMQEVGLGSFVSKDILGKPYVNDFVNASKIIEERLKGLRKQSASVQEKLPLAEKVAADLARQAQQAQEMQSIATEGDGNGAGKTGGTSKERESQVPLLQLQLATTEQIFELERQIMTAKLGENELEVIRLEGLKEQLRINEEIAKVRLNNDLPAQEKALQIQKLMKDAELARLQTNFDMEMKILEVFKKVQDRVVEIGREAANELSDKREYERLVTEGVLPSVAKITVEVNRQFAAEAEKIKLLEAQIDDQIALLENEREQTKNKERLLQIEIQLAKLRANKQLVVGTADTLPELAGETIQSRVQAGEGKSAYTSIKEEAEELEKQLKELVSTQGLVKFSANAIGEAFASSFKDAITGAATAQEALAGFFRSVGNAFADMAAQMIQKMITMYILNQFLNILPSAGGMFSGDASIKGGGFADFSGGSFGVDTGGMFGQTGAALTAKPFANGGIVTGPTLGLIGEGRYNEAVVPLPDGKTIPVDLGGAAGNQIVSNITVNVNNGQTQSNANGSNSSELGRKLEGAVKQVIVGELRPGGLLAR